ncbi:MAG: acylphosphatase [Woeseiaceae bacterium]|nr:acylphosphatase [Woeseiaceae bacterium]
MPCRQFIISGRVQGVFFRASTRDVALRLNLRGHAVNKPDGTVEVLACGEATALDELEQWLHEGPAHATVSAVEARDVSCKQPDSFRTG